MKIELNKTIIGAVSVIVLLDIIMYYYWLKGKFDYFITILQAEFAGILIGVVIGLVMYFSSKQNKSTDETNKKKIRTTEESECIMKKYALDKFGMITKKAPEFSLPIKIGEEQTDAQVCLFQSETYNDEFIILFQGYNDKNRTYHVRNQIDIQKIMNMDLEDRQNYLEKAMEHMATKKRKITKEVMYLTSNGERINLKDVKVTNDMPKTPFVNGIGQPTGDGK